MFVAVVTYVVKEEIIGDDVIATEASRAFGPFDVLPSDEERFSFDVWVDSIFEPGHPVLSCEFVEVCDVPKEVAEIWN